MKKIAIFVPYLRESGVCKVAANQSIMFYRSGYEIDLIVMDDNVVYPYAGNLVNLNIKSRKGLLKIFSYIELLIKFKRYINNTKYDIVLSHTPHCDFINTCCSKDTSIIVTVHSNIFKKYSKISQFLLRYIVKNATSVVTVSKYTKQQIVDVFPKYAQKVKCIYNNLDFKNIDKQIKKKKPLPEDTRYILSIGRFTLEKGQWHLIKVFAKLSKLYPELKLVMLGNGDLENSFKELVQKLNITEKVLFEGFQDNPYIYMHNADLVVLPSLHEGFPLVLIEAMACSTTVIATDCAGPREIIAPSKDIAECLDYNEKFEYGFLLPDFANVDDLFKETLSKGEKLLLQKIEKVLQNPKLLENKNRERALLLSEEKIMKEWKNLFQELEQEA